MANGNPGKIEFCKPDPKTNFHPERFTMSRYRLLTILSSIAMLSLATDARAVAPSLSAVTPYGFQRGTEVEASFAGARLGDAQELMF